MSFGISSGPRTYDLRFAGETAFFSWPSRGERILGYASDEAAIEASEQNIAQFLIDFATRTGVESLHLIAHSMGNRGLLRALQRIANIARESGVSFGQIILAAPDIDQGTFRSLAHHYGELSQRTTLYLSANDRAVWLSQLVHRYPRVGLSPPVTVVDGIDTIEVPKFDVFDLLGHGYFAEAGGVLHDIFDLLTHNKCPKDRQRLVKAQTDDGRDYWTME